jgi:hypothetical protein
MDENCKDPGKLDHYLLLFFNSKNNDLYLVKLYCKLTFQLAFQLKRRNYSAFGSLFNYY